MKSFYTKITLLNVIVLLSLLALGITIQGIIASAGDQYTHYNNFMIFKSSFGHLIQNKNLYLYYDKEYFDLYKYSPTFAALMGFYYYIPNEVGLFLFNIINTSLFVVALLKLKIPADKVKFLLLFLLLEFGISITWVQTNVLITALIILAFSLLENKKPLLASLLIVVTVYIKLYSVVALGLAIFYPQRFRFVLYTVIWSLVFALLPLLIIPKNELVQQYQNWFYVLKMDHDASYGVSFIGLLHSWFKINVSKAGTAAVAAIIFCIPLLQFKWYKFYFFRLQILASLLLWLVIFNYKGESPTYIIAMTGVAIWYFSQPPNKANKILLWLALIFTSFTSTDVITPGWINDRFVEPYSVKAVFCSVIWFKLIFDLMTKKQFVFAGEEEVENKQATAAATFL